MHEHPLTQLYSTFIDGDCEVRVQRQKIVIFVLVSTLLHTTTTTLEMLLETGFKAGIALRRDVFRLILCSRFRPNSPGWLLNGS